jgi:ribosomal protein L34E
MSKPCGRARSWLDDDEDRAPTAREQKARSEHLRACADCREELKGIVAQRATVNGVFSAEAPLPSVSGALVAKCVKAMVRASGEQRGAGRSTG